MKYFLIFSFFLTTSAQGFDRITGLPFASRSEVIGQHGMAATSHPLATQAAIDILKDGGNAIDAAIAANALLGLVEPTGCGVGGDLFAIIWDAKTKQLYGLNASGPSPKNSSIEFMKSKGITQIPRYGPHPVTVPGAVAGWSAMHKRFGNKEFHTLFESAIDYAVNGFPVTELIAYYLEGSAENFQNFPNFKSVWMPNGTIPKKGDIFRNPHLANTYQSIANSYGESFYKGEIAEDFISGLKGLFEDHYIDVPDEKYDILEANLTKIEELENKLNKQIEENIQLKKTKGELVKESMIADVADGMTDTETEKFQSLVDDVEFSDEDSYKEKLQTIKESYFGTGKVESEETEVLTEEGSEESLYNNGDKPGYSRSSTDETRFRWIGGMGKRNPKPQVATV